PAGMRQRVDGAVEPELGQALGLTRARAEAGAPEEALGLRLAERSTVNGRHPAIIGGESDGPLCPFGLELATQNRGDRGERDPRLLVRGLARSQALQREPRKK